MQAAKYWRNKKLRYRLLMMERLGDRPEAEAKERRQSERDRQPDVQRVKTPA